MSSDFLDDYSGESLEELLAMERTHRIDSLVLAMETALGQKQHKRGDASLSPEERVILAIEELEREVNNGGYHQFFLDSSREFAGEIEAALTRIGCPKHADIARRAVAALGLEGTKSPDDVEAAVVAGGDPLFDVLDALDKEYFSCKEPIADRLFAFVKANRSKITLQ